jgi:hypothetical protein
MHRLRPSKPMAILGAILGVAMVVFGLVQFGGRGGFIWLWAVFGIAIVGFNLWAAFAKRGATHVVESDAR